MKKLLCVLMALLLVFGTACGKDGGKEKEEESPVQSVNVNGREMEYIRFGKEGGDCFVILPGLSLKSVMGSADAIAAAYALMAEEYEVYLFDHVKTEPEGYSIDDMAADTLAALGELGIDKAKIMGVSMGGMVAQAIALRDPNAVSCLVLCSTAAKGGDVPALRIWRELAEKRDAKALSRSFGEYVYTPSFYEQYREIIDAMGEGAAEQEYANFLVSIEAIKGFDLSGRLGEISCPAYVLGAGEDRVLGAESSYELMDGLGCEGHIYEDRGHGVYDEVPDYLQRIMDFAGALPR